MAPFADPDVSATLVDAVIRPHRKILIFIVIGSCCTLILIWLGRLSQLRRNISLLFAMPAPGQTLPTGNHPVRLKFGQGIDREISNLRLIGPRGLSEELTIGSVSAFDVISAQMQLRCPGEYTLRWKISSLDGIRYNGRIRFRATLIFIVDR
jgi:methionine-rich copper-binding protein CopC